MAFKPIQIVINAKDNASAVLGRLEGKIKAVGIAVAGYFGIKAFAGGIQGAAEFEAAMSAVKAATSAGAKEMQLLRGAVKQAMLEGVNGNEAAKALENFGKAGLSAADAVKALPAAIQLSAAGAVDLAQASEYVSKAVMGMGLSFDDAARVADVLALGANATNTSVEGLAQALSYAAPVANSLGVSLESTVAIIGKFADAGIDAGRAGTALNSIMSQFANPASKFRQELGAAGIVTTDFEKALHQLAASGPAGKDAINAVGLEAGPALRALLNQGMGSLDELTGKLRESAGSAKSFGDILKDNLKGALNKLSGAWEVASEALQKPVLPVLRKGVEELTVSLRRLVDDGTVARMGSVLASAFDNGIKGVQAFLGALNVDQIILRLQVMASEVGEAFQRVTTFATNAGNAVRMAWGVMSAGTSAVMAVIYKVGEAFAGVASNIQSGVAVIMDGLSRITFGSVSASFKAAAEEIRLSAEATWASSQALAEKSSEAFNAMADGAQLARDGWGGLTASVEQSAGALPAVAQELERVAAGVEKVEQASTKAKAAADAKAQSDVQAAEAVKRLRVEYQELISQGNLQEAAKRLQDIDKAQQALAKSGPQAADAAALMEQAYKDLGLKTNAELQEAATKARAAFEALAKDGTQPPQRIADAWKVMAERVIDANGGVAPSWLKVDAAVRQYEISVDGAGKSVASTENATLRATGNMAKGYDSLGRAAEGAEQRMRNAGKVPPPGRAPGGSKPEKPDDGPKPKPQPQADIPEGATEDESQRLKDARRQGSWVYDRELKKVQDRIKQDGWKSQRQAEKDVLEQQAQSAREQAASLKTGGSDRDLLKEMLGGSGPMQSVFPKGAVTFQMPQVPLANPAQAVPSIGVAAPSAAAASVQVFKHEFALPGGNLVVNAADEPSSDALNQLFEQLERGAQMAGGVR